MKDKKDVMSITIGTLILTSLLLTLTLTKFLLKQNDIKEINNYKQKFNTALIINNDNDFRNDNGFKLDSKENVKLATDSISNLVPNIENIDYIYLLAILNAGNINSEFNINISNCFKKSYLENKAVEYFDNIDINFDNFVNLTNYYCSKKINNFKSNKPYYVSIIEDRRNLTMIYKKVDENNLESTIHYNFILKQGVYKLNNVNIINN